MDIQRFDIPGLLLFTPPRHGDERGTFCEVFRADQFEREVGDVGFVQDNVSRSSVRGTIRGLHYQAPPMAQGKLVRASIGAIFDVAVDVRKGSPTYGRHITVELSDENWHQLWVPAGFLHGFCTLTDHTEVSYKVTHYYSAEDDGAVAFDDPELNIHWPFQRDQAVLSAKDRDAPSYRSWQTPFTAGR